MLGISCSSQAVPVPEPTPGPAPKPVEPSTAGVLRADGNSAGTYALITRCGYNGVEAPDQSGCHTQIQHITQSYDEQLGKHVFHFQIHIAQDNDRNIASITDRQRNEIKTDAKSPASMVGQVGETMILKWKFRLPAGMKTTDKFCHVHQLKGIDNAAGTADVGNPVITFTARSLSNGKQQFQVIYVPPTAQGGGNQYLSKVDLTDFLGEWVEVEERILCHDAGKYQTRITRIRDGKELVSIPSMSVAMWREGTTGMRPKWGIYRSFGSGGSLKAQLRDEILDFADFSIEKPAR